MGYKVLLPQAIAEAGNQLLLDAGHTLIAGKGFSTQEILEDVIEHKPDAMIIRIATITREVIEANPNLKVIARHGAGFDAIDIQACYDNGVQPVYAPVANSTSVAETAFLLMLECSRNVKIGRDCMVEDFYKAKLKVPKIQLSGKTIGIVGCGNIGSRVAKRALAMEMNVLAYDPYKPAADFPDGVEVVRDLDRIFKESDFVSMHCPPSPVTRKLVNKENLAKMKPTAYLINTARGAIVDEEALYEALKDGVIAGAGLDVLKSEPMDPNNPLLNMDNVYINAHIGGATAEANVRASYFCAMGVNEVAAGEKPTWPIIPVDYETAQTYTDTKKPDTKPAGLFDY